MNSTNYSKPMSLEELKADFDSFNNTSAPALEPSQAKQEEVVLANHVASAGESELTNAKPSELGYIPLLNEWRPTVAKVIKHFDLAYSEDDFWLHLNTKLLGNLSGSALDEISPYNLIEFLIVCMDNNLNPLKSEVTGYYDSFSRTLKTQILLDGYCRIYSSHPQTDGMEYVYHDKQSVEVTVSYYEYDPKTRERVAKKRKVNRELPRTVECKIYRKDRKFPTIGCADIEDLGTSAAWQQHPLQMMRNRAFTRAVRMCYNLEGASYADIDDLKENIALDLNIQRAQEKAMQAKELEVKQALKGATCADEMNRILNNLNEDDLKLLGSTGLSALREYAQERLNRLKELKAQAQAQKQMANVVKPQPVVTAKAQSSSNDDPIARFTAMHAGSNIGPNDLCDLSTMF